MAGFLLGSLALLGCYNPNYGNGKFSCSRDKTCPPGYHCGSDQLCWADGSSGSDTRKIVDASAADHRKREGSHADAEILVLPTCSKFASTGTVIPVTKKLAPLPRTFAMMIEEGGSPFAHFAYINFSASNNLKYASPGSSKTAPPYSPVELARTAVSVAGTITSNRTVILGWIDALVNGKPNVGSCPLSSKDCTTDSDFTFDLKASSFHMNANAIDIATGELGSIIGLAGVPFIDGSVGAWAMVFDQLGASAPLEVIGLTDSPADFRISVGKASVAWSTQVGAQNAVGYAGIFKVLSSVSYARTAVAVDKDGATIFIALVTDKGELSLYTWDGTTPLPLGSFSAKGVEPDSIDLYMDQKTGTLYLSYIVGSSTDGLDLYLASGNSTKGVSIYKLANLSPYKVVQAGIGTRITLNPKLGHLHVAAGWRQSLPADGSLDYVLCKL
jgi:hypothetical protein